MKPLPLKLLGAFGAGFGVPAGALQSLRRGREGPCTECVWGSAGGRDPKGVLDPKGLRSHEAHAFQSHENNPWDQGTPPNWDIPMGLHGSGNVNQTKLYKRSRRWRCRNVDARYARIPHQTYTRCRSQALAEGAANLLRPLGAHRP